VLRLERLGIDIARQISDVILGENCREWVWVVHWSACEWNRKRIGRNGQGED